MDRISSSARSRNMAAIRSRDTKPEMIVRRLVHGLGYRYRLHRKNLPGNPDLVFGPRRKVIFVHGCFWHRHPNRNCKRAHAPRSNTDYWRLKLQRNSDRDKKNIKLLKQTGWKIQVIWECETKDAVKLEAKIIKFLN